MAYTTGCASPLLAGAMSLELLALLLALSAARSAAWQVGRVTWYDSIDAGSCGFGPIGSGSVTGRDVAALSDVAEDYANSCGCVRTQMYDRVQVSAGLNSLCHRHSPCSTSVLHLSCFLSCP